MILQLEEDCLNVYRKKVEQTRKQKEDLIEELSFGESDIEKILSALGERESFSRVCELLYPFHAFLYVSFAYCMFLHMQVEKLGGTLLEQLAKVEPVLEDLRRRRDERVEEFMVVQAQIVRLHAEISGTIENGDPVPPLVDETNLSLRRLAEFKSQLKELQTEKVVHHL